MLKRKMYDELLESEILFMGNVNLFVNSVRL